MHEKRMWDGARNEDALSAPRNICPFLYGKDRAADHAASLYVPPMYVRSVATKALWWLPRASLDGP